MDDILDLLKEYDFLLTNKINIDFMCIVCKKLLTNPRVGPCGCRYCKICIENYLKNGDNICPGSTDECKEENLNLIENINIDHFINRKIAKLKLNCPIESCTFSDQIINMKQHLIVCRENAIKCSFSENGCNFISLSEDNADKHCKMSKDKHLELVLRKVENMSNIIDSLNKNKIDLLQQIETLKYVNKTLEIENDNDKIIKKQHKMSIKQINNYYNQLKAQNDIQKKQIDDYKMKYENEINNKNNLIKYLSESLIGKEIEFIWKITSFGQGKLSQNKRRFDKYFIFKNDLWMELSMEYKNICGNVYDTTVNYYTIIANLSHHDNSLNSSCPFTFDFIIGIVNKNCDNFVVSFTEKTRFTSSGISFKKDILENKLISETTNDCLTVKCLIKLSF